VEAQKKEVAKVERTKKARFDQIVTMLDLSNAEYREMRKNNLFAMAKNTKDNSFHRREQELIFKEVYAKMTKDTVCPQNTIDFGHLQKHAYFKEALWITEKLGLHLLMKINQDYNIVLMHQFFATVVFGEGEDIPLTWMIGSDVCHSSFRPWVFFCGCNHRYWFEDAR
jgi:hypothetical protein